MEECHFPRTRALTEESFCRFTDGVSSYSSHRLPRMPVNEGAQMHADLVHSPRQTTAQQDKEATGKRKVGRPIAYCGDPNAPDLTPAQRRIVLRRIANRESARRVRSRRHDEYERLLHQAETVEASTGKLRQRIEAAQEQGQSVREEAEGLHRHVLARDAENRSLREEVSRLRQRMLDLQRASPQCREPAVTGCEIDCSPALEGSDALMLPLVAKAHQALPEPEDAASFFMDDSLDAPALFSQAPEPVNLEKSFSEFLHTISV